MSAFELGAISACLVSDWPLTALLSPPGEASLEDQLNDTSLSNDVGNTRAKQIAFR